MKKLIMGSSVLTIGVIIACIGMLSMYSAEIDQHTQTKEIKNWSVLGADGTPTGSGMLEVFIYNHTSSPELEYITNLSSGDAKCYASTNAWNASAGTAVPYDTLFDIVIKVRFNETHAWNSTGSVWQAASDWAVHGATAERNWIRANITCSDLSIVAQNMSYYEIVNTTASAVDYIWVNFYINNGGAGYQISHGESINVTDIDILAYY